jgi:hypothetical protein
MGRTYFGLASGDDAGDFGVGGAATVEEGEAVVVFAIEAVAVVAAPNMDGNVNDAAIVAAIEVEEAAGVAGVFPPPAAPVPAPVPALDNGFDEDARLEIEEVLTDRIFLALALLPPVTIDRVGVLSALYAAAEPAAVVLTTAIAAAVAAAVAVLAVAEAEAGAEAVGVPVA